MVFNFFSFVKTVHFQFLGKPREPTFVQENNIAGPSQWFIQELRIYLLPKPPTTNHHYSTTVSQVHLIRLLGARTVIVG